MQLIIQTITTVVILVCYMMTIGTIPKNRNVRTIVTQWEQVTIERKEQSNQVEEFC